MAVERLAVAPSTRLGSLQAMWGEIVGPAIAENCTPVADHEGVVHVQCDASVWVRELSLLKPEILTRLAENQVFEWVVDLRFKLPD